VSQVLLTPEEVAALLQGLNRAETDGGAGSEPGPALGHGPGPECSPRRGPSRGCRRTSLAEPPSWSCRGGSIKTGKLEPE
jgi:hypothetical protein